MVFNSIGMRLKHQLFAISSPAKMIVRKLNAFSTVPGSDYLVGKNVSSIGNQITNKRHKWKTKQFSFSILQYNILASYLGRNTQPWFLYGIDVPPEKRNRIFEKFYARSTQPPYTLLNRGWPNYVRGILDDKEIGIVERIDKEYFDWAGGRFERLLDKIESLSVDIISLVELDRYEELSERLSVLGYESRFIRRPRNTSLDGCSILWRQNRFSLVASSYAYLPDHINPKTGEPVMDRCCLSVLLQTKNESTLEDDDQDTFVPEYLVVVSMHLARNPEDDTKDFLRGSQLAHVIDHVINFMSRHDVKDAPVLFCGDVNALSLTRLKGIASVAAIFSQHRMQVFNALNFRVAPTNHTTYTTARTMRIDAILYQTTHFDLIESGAIPSPPVSPTAPKKVFDKLIESFTTCEVLPNLSQPSDHLPIMAKMRIKPQLEKCRDAALQWWRVVSYEPNPTKTDYEGNDWSFEESDTDDEGENYIYDRENDLMQLGPKELSLAFQYFLFQEPVYLQSGREMISQSGINRTTKMLGFDKAQKTINKRNIALPLNYAEFCAEFYSNFVDCAYGIDAVFDMLDINSDGVISKDELIRFFKEFAGTSLQVTPVNTKEIIAYAHRKFPPEDAIKTSTTNGDVEWIKPTRDQFKRLVITRYVEVAGFPSHVKECITKKLLASHNTKTNM